MGRGGMQVVRCEVEIKMKGKKTSSGMKEMNSKIKDCEVRVGGKYKNMEKNEIEEIEKAY